MSSRNFVTMATWRKDFLLLTVYKAHSCCCFYFTCLSFDGGQDLDTLTTQIEEWATVQFYSFIYSNEQEKQVVLIPLTQEYLYMYIFKEKKNQNTHQNDLSLGHEDFPFNAPCLEPTVTKG